MLRMTQEKARSSPKSEADAKIAAKRRDNDTASAAPLKAHTESVLPLPGSERCSRRSVIASGGRGAEKAVAAPTEGEAVNVEKAILPAMKKLPELSTRRCKNPPIHEEYSSKAGSLQGGFSPTCANNSYKNDNAHATGVHQVGLTVTIL